MRLLIAAAVILLAVGPAGAFLVTEPPPALPPVFLDPDGDYVGSASSAEAGEKIYVAFVEMNRTDSFERIGIVRFASWIPSSPTFANVYTIVGPTLVKHLWVLDLAIDSHGRMYVLTAISEPQLGQIQLFTSTDDGATWRALPVPRSTNPNAADEPGPAWGSLAIDDADSVYLSTQGYTTHVFKSTSHAETFDEWEIALDSVETEYPVPDVAGFLNLRDGVVDTDAAGNIAVAGRRLIVPLTHLHVSLSVASPEDGAFSPQRVALATKASGYPNLAAGLPGHVTIVYDSGLGPGLVRAATTTDGGLTWINQALTDFVAKDDRVDIFMGQTGPGIAADDHGNVVAAWTQTDKATGVREIGYAASRDGGLTWTRPGVLPTWTQPGIESVNAVVTIADGVAYILVRNGPGLAMYPVPLG